MSKATFKINPSTKIMGTLAHAGYSIETAIADLIDNSIAAKAHNISVYIHFEDDDCNNWYLDIVDDGEGMDSDSMESALKMSERGMWDERDNSDLGRYGIGLKTASISQANKLTVISKTKRSKTIAKGIDVDDMISSNEWIGYTYNDDKYLKLIKEHGTIVRWEKLKFVQKDGISSSNKKDLYSKIDTIEKHLSMVFHRFIERKQIVIKIQNRIIEPWDPFCTYHRGTNNFDEDILEVNGSTIKVESYSIPNTSNCSDEELEKIYRGNALETQGFYVYRNDRIIIGGGWLNSKKIRKHQSYNRLRISIDFNSILDEFLNVGFTKDSIDFPAEVMNALDRIALKSRNKVKNDTKERIIRQDLIKPDKGKIWIEKKQGDQIYFKINKEHPLVKHYTDGIDETKVKKLFSLLENNCPRITILDIKKHLGFDEKELNSQLKEYVGYRIMNQYNEYKLNKNKFLDKLKKDCLNIAPFDEHQDLVQAYFDNEVSNYEW